LRNITIHAIQKVVSRFRDRSERIDNLLNDNEILRMALIASKIPVAKGPKDRLVDIGGKVLWLPIYSELLGYKEVVILCRPGGAFTE
jgi:hypothetical protein